MAFSLGASNSAAGGTPAELGPELSDVYTDEIGFKGVSGDSNIRLLPTPWPSEALPSPTSSLLAVAQSKGLVVGAGPDCLVIATTDSIRQAIATSEGDQNSKTKAFQPQATIPLPTRPTHVAFSASEDALILATEGGSQISVFETATLLQGNSQPALSVPTNGVSIRALAPNPDPTSTFAALVTVNGELLMADLKAASLISGPSGSVLRNAVSCVSWSNKGKQLVAGLADGSADQMTADGTSKAQIPRPSDLEGECHVSSIAWLENDVFFMIYTPNGLEDDMGGNPQSHYYIITRRKQAPFLIQKMPEICNTMGFSIKRAPAYQFIARLRDFQPHLRDVLMVSSTLSTDVGLIARSDKPLAHDEAAKSVVGQFTVAEVNDDTKRAALPLAENSDETSVIGLSTDLTSRDNVIAPLQGEDIAESSSPLPALFLLNNQGHLAAWWFVYSESVRQKVPYPGLVSPQQSASGNTPSLGAPAFGKPGGSTFGSTSTMGATAFGRPSAPAFGSPGQLGGSAPAFGQPSAPVSSFGKSSGPAFGSSSQLGGPSPAFGQPSAPAPSFGTPSAPGSGFGSSGLAKPQFGQSGFGTGGSTFGQTSTPAKSLLGSASDGGGFGSFSGGAGGGFGSLAAAKPGDSALGSKSDAPTPFGKGSGFGTGGFGSFSGGAGGQSAFAQSSNSTAFGAQQQTDSPFAPKPNAPKNPFGKSTGGFVLGSSFKPDGTAANDGPKPDKPSSGAFSFGGSFDEIVSSPSKPSPPAESMDDEADVPTPASQPPAKTEPASIFGAPSKPSAPTTSLFGNLTTQPSKPPAESNKSSFSLFGSSSTAQTSAQTNTQTTQNQVTSPLSAPSDKTATPKREQSVSTPTFPSLEAPLPPDSTTRASYAPGDTSASSNVSKSSVEDAPFPPDFISSKSTPKHDDAPLPPDFLSKPKKAEAPPPVPEDAPLPPDPTTRKAKSETSAAIPEDAPLPPDPTTTKVKVESPPAVPEDAPLPPDPTAAKKLPPKEAVPVPDDSGSEQDADESDFSDSGEEITHEETKIPSPKPSAESSFGGLSDKSSTGGLFGGMKKTAEQERPRSLFGEIPKQPLLPLPGPAAQTGREPPRSPSPVRPASQKNRMPSQKEARPEPGSTLNSRKASLARQAQREGHLKKPSDVVREEQTRMQAVALQREEEPLSLSDDDEDERLRADLARPVDAVNTLDPFLPHQDCTGDKIKPGIPGMVERLYRDINSMVYTLGINSRSLESYLLYQQSSQSPPVDKLVELLQSENPDSIFDKKLFLKDIGVLDEIVATLGRTLDQKRVQGVEEKTEQCQDLITKDIVTLRGQCAALRKTLDAHTDSGAILAVPLSAEQTALQQDLRTAFAGVQAKMAELEQGVALMRAQLADIPRGDGESPMRQSKRPTVEAVTSTIGKLMAMAEEKTSDMAHLERTMKKLGIDTSGSTQVTPTASPFTTPRKNTGRVPRTPGSRGSVDGSAYHTPESASRGINFRASLNGSARTSHLRKVQGAGPSIAHDESSGWKTQHLRRRQLAQNLKRAAAKQPAKVRGLDDL